MIMKSCFKALVSSTFCSMVMLAPTLVLADDTANEKDGESTQVAADKNVGRSTDRFLRRIIVQGSVANAGYQGGDTPRYSGANGFSAGVLMDLIGSKNVVVETGALYRQFGTDYNNGLGDNTFTANYLSIPIDVKYYFVGQESTSLYVKAGVMGSTLLSSNTLYATPTTQIGARSWETALLGGVGLKLNLDAASDLVVEGAYSRSIDSVFNDANVYRSDISATFGFAVNL